MVLDSYATLRESKTTASWDIDRISGFTMLSLLDVLHVVFCYKRRNIMYL